MTLDGIDITDNMVWTDEFQFNQVEQARDRTLTGGLIVQEGAKQFGRPITLDRGWLPRSTVDALHAKEAQSGLVMALALPDGRTFDVAFNRARGPAVNARPVFDHASPSTDPGWQYQVTIRLITVEPQ